MRTAQLALIPALLCSLCTAATAAAVFSTGTTSASTGGYNTSGGFSVSNAFTLAADSHLTDLVLGLAVSSGYSVSSIGWRIGSSFFGSDVASGAALSFGIAGVGVYGGIYDVFNLTMDIPDIDLAAGTYYLSLQAAASGSSVYWQGVVGDSGLSPLAHQRSGSSELGNVQRSSFSFNGTQAATSVPEPGALSLAVAALLAAGFARRRA